MSELIEVTFDDLILRVGDDSDGRTLEGYLVPWDKPAQVSRPIPGYEVFKRGALTRSVTESKTPIPLLGLHSEDRPIGRLERSHDDETGQYGVFRLFDTEAAREARELVREGIWRGLSVGGFGVPARTEVRKATDGKNLVVRSEIRLDHVGLVRTPAFEDARVMALRSAEAFDAVAVAKARKRQLQLLRQVGS